MSNFSTFSFEIVTLNRQGEEIKRERKKANCLLENLGQDLILEMVALGGGTFLMGSPPTEEGWHPCQTPQHLVTISPFWMGKYPITQDQWQAVATLAKIERHLDPHPANFVGGNRPVEQVSWYDAMEFCARLSQYTGLEYRLPSESEWEYACRACRGEQPFPPTPFHFGESIRTDLANYSGIDWEYQGKICSKGAYAAGPLGEDRRETTPVGRFQVANAFGLYDLHGNVREWCADTWHDNYQGAPTDGKAWIAGGESNRRVLRGGSWNGGPRRCRSAFRIKFAPEASLYDIGFRVACSSYSIEAS
jgi:formylglycine-generating enzyme required for sulfatase activity